MYLNARIASHSGTYSKNTGKNYKRIVFYRVCSGYFWKNIRTILYMSSRDRTTVQQKLINYDAAEEDTPFQLVKLVVQSKEVHTHSSDTCWTSLTSTVWWLTHHYLPLTSPTTAKLRRNRFIQLSLSTNLMTAIHNYQSVWAELTRTKTLMSIQSSLVWNGNRQTARLLSCSMRFLYQRQQLVGCLHSWITPWQWDRQYLWAIDHHTTDCVKERWTGKKVHPPVS